jgi:CHASE3 domain sensor protein/GAF domain-containing protein
MIEFFKKHLIKIATGIVCLLILTSSALTYNNHQKISRALILKEQSAFALKEVERTYQNIQLMDISSRGYKIIRKPEYLFWSVKTARDRNKEVFQNLDSIFRAQGFDNPEKYNEMKKGLDDYTNMYAEMVQYLQANEDSLYVALLEKDLGRHFWDVYNPFSKHVNDFEQKTLLEAEETHKSAVASNFVVQLFLILIGIPTLIFVIIRMTREERERIALLLDVDQNNNIYLFNDGNSVQRDAESILGKLILNLQKAATFVNEISSRNYQAKWDGLDERNSTQNQGTLAGRLMYMRDEMMKVKAEDVKRLWSTEGLSELSQIIRQHQNSLDDLTGKALTFIIRYTKSQQGSVFVLTHNEEEQPYLDLKACYAFDRKKFVEKKINPGDGLVGQTFLEGKPMLMTNVPAGYIHITSGLGHATPSCVIIVPMKYNEVTYAVLELASFEVYEDHQIQFLEKACEFFASAIASVQNNEKNRLMVEQMTSQTEQLRAQEEELRQNLEELEATQEDMRRKIIVR